MKSLLRPNIAKLKPYSSARDEFHGAEATVFLDANENPYNQPFNRYPDPLQHELKQRLAQLRKVREGQIFLGNGSDEAIDLLYRCFCIPGTDNVVAIEPTYGMYRVCADINDVEYRTVMLDEHFQTTADDLFKATDEHTKLIWICSPNNPTGNNINRDEVSKLLASFKGIVVIDEAYSDFSKQVPFRTEIDKWPRLVVLNTMSKAWGCAALRLGIAYASEEIIEVMNKVKYPYNINLLTQQQALEELKDTYNVEKWVNMIIQERDRLIPAFLQLPTCVTVYPTNANFFLARMTNAQEIYDYLVGRGIIVRNRTRISLCHNCLRVTVGTRTENSELLAALRQYQ